ncbi:MAG: protein phosphatase 2C domain-containing protein [Wenzhouxiangella sp.]|jgi:protein phosphatase|nr:protein phosphatase 2C domain-containing protein [Wenzhouxiangella sp.]
MNSDDTSPSRSTGQSQTGKVRADNQDAILADDAVGLWLVADGMGGYSGGAQASALAKATVRDAIVDGQALEDAILAAHSAICDQQRAHPELADMGTTIVALVEHGQDYEIAWVGDSRAYLFDRTTGVLNLLTRDHSWAGQLLEAGEITASEAERHPRRHVLTDCLGIHLRAQPRVDRYPGTWNPGHWVLLCSDGLSGELSAESMALALSEAKDMAAAADRLMAEALKAGAKDNVSLVLVGPPLSAL